MEEKILLILFLIPIYIFSIFSLLYNFDIFSFIISYFFTIIYSCISVYYFFYFKIYIREKNLRDSINKEIQLYLEKKKINNVYHEKYKEMKKYLNFLYLEITYIFVDFNFMKSYIDEDKIINQKIKNVIIDMARNNKNYIDFRINNEEINIYLGEIHVLQKKIVLEDKDVSLNSFYILDNPEGDVLNNRLYNI